MYNQHSLIVRVILFWNSKGRFLRRVTFVIKPSVSKRDFCKFLALIKPTYF